MVAYSIYKQNKRAWLDDFVKATARTPTEAETRSYIIGESTERRLATYRQLAAATLGGQSVRLKGSSSTSIVRSGRLTGALWALVALAALAVFAFAPALRSPIAQRTIVSRREARVTPVYSQRA